MQKQSLVFVFVIVLFVVSGCAEAEPRTVEVTREVQVPKTIEVTREVTKIVEHIVKETVEVVVTATPAPSPEPTSPPRQSTPAAASASSPVGTIRVDHWVLEITEARSDPGMDASRQSVVLLGNLTNEGTQNDTFSALGTLMLQDSRGRMYEDDQNVTWAAEDKYGAEIPASMSPGATRYIAIGFDVLAEERSFTIVPGSLVASWGGNISFSLP
jgi:hypothetical protein